MFVLFAERRQVTGHCVCH